MSNKKIQEGYYSDKYFCRTKEILLKDKYHPVVRMQLFQKNKAILCGVKEVVSLLKESLGKDYKKLKIFTLPEGSIIKPYETVMIIEGDYSLFAHLETVYLGILARSTRIATNAFNCMQAARPKPVLFFAARFDRYENQERDGYAYEVARMKAYYLKKIIKKYKLGGVSTDAQGSLIKELGLGTIPHGLIAAYNGDTVKATLKFAQYMNPKIPRISLVDFDNDCVATSARVAIAMREKYNKTKDERYILSGVRLDTSSNMVDWSIKQGNNLKNPCGVNKQLVRNVRNELNFHGFEKVKIIVSGGFTPEKIKDFKYEPVDAYGVGSSMFKGNFDFTADIVSIKKDKEWKSCAKVGRQYNPNEKLKRVR